MSSSPNSSAQLVQAKRLATLLLAGMTVPALACGTFSTQFPIDSAMPPVIETPTVAMPTSTPIVIPTPNLQASEDGSQEAGGALGTVLARRIPFSNIDLTVGERARIVASEGINLREEASTHSPVVSRLANGVLVLVLDGPFQNDGLYWWQVETVNKQLAGMVAEGLPEEPWLEPALGAIAPVNRDPVVGDRVLVSIARLNLRESPSLNAAVVEVITEGSEFIVLEGPLERDNYTWYRVRLMNGELNGWSVSHVRAEQRALTPLE